ncbi:winged helix-turn-helix domain-containing protein [Piscinibacter sp. XHJ-5]|uniref:winged helix-turn-helix domain-containing tetratricopeptide repeat protein n=1 Tax=Piscinibacter sp. XHJ-5 TaxID=3037797 RepID=UPI002453441F|nr:winged helix-turn-helix domain-containing protein [Piscinibacter sp. XHJ-5]
MAKRYAFGDFVLDTARGTLTRDGAALAVGQRGLSLLQALLEAGGEPVAKAELMRRAWPGLVVEDSNLPVQITALRKLLGPSLPDGTEWIVTVPRLGYRLTGPAAVEDTQLAPLEHGEPDHGGRPAIAVLPFTLLGDDPAHEYLADGVTEALITTLTRFRWFSVTGRNASQVYKLRKVDSRTAGAELGVRYLLEGSVRRSAERVRISAQLVEAASGQCLWAEQHDFSGTDVFEVQDAIAMQVAGAIEPELLKSAGSQARRRGGSMSAWDLVAQGAWLFHHVSRPTHLKARELFRQAGRIDAEMTEARWWLGRVDAGLAAYGWSEDAVVDLREGHAAALEAVQLDEKHPYAHYALAIVSNYLDEFPLALRSAEKAVELSPSFALGHLVHGMAGLYSGDARGAVQSLERGLQLNRYDPQNFVWYNVLALAYLFESRADHALQRAVAALKVRPAWRPAMRTAAAANAALGRHEAAAQWLRRWTETPATSADALQPLWRCNPRWEGEMRRLLEDGRGPFT